jgi:arylsulfatase A
MSSRCVRRRAGSYGPKLVNDFALDSVKRHKNHPFLLYYSMILTLDPFQPTPDIPNWDPKAQGEQANRQAKHFADIITYMDKLIGRLDTKLGELGTRENSLLIF